MRLRLDSCRFCLLPEEQRVSVSRNLGVPCGFGFGDARGILILNCLGPSVNSGILASSRFFGTSCFMVGLRRSESFAGLRVMVARRLADEIRPGLRTRTGFCLSIESSRPFRSLSLGRLIVWVWSMVRKAPEFRPRLDCFQALSSYPSSEFDKKAATSDFGKKSTGNMRLLPPMWGLALRLCREKERARLPDI